MRTMPEQYQSIPYSPEVGDYPYDPQKPEDEPKESKGLVSWALLPLIVCIGVFEQMEGRSWIAQVMALLVLGLWVVVDLIVRRQGIRFYTPFLLLACWVFWEMIPTVMESVPIDVMIVGFFGIIKVWGLACVVSNIIRRPQQMIPLFIGACLVPSVMLMSVRQDISKMQSEMARGIQNDQYRLGDKQSGGGLGDANNLSHFACYDLIAGTALFLLWKGKTVRWVALLTLVPTLVYITFTGSRTGMVAIPMLALAFWFFYLRDVSRKRPALKIAALVCMVLMVGGGIIYILTSPFAYRFTDRTSSYSDGRGALATVALNMTMSSPILGWGLYGFNEHGPEFGAPTFLSVSHNTYTEMLVMGGLPGFLLYYAAWFVTIRQMWSLRKLPLTRQERIVINLALLCCINYMWFMMTLTTIIPRFAWTMIGACIGVTYGIRDKYIQEGAVQAEAVQQIPLSPQPYMARPNYY